jgi:hypothetical protein
LTPGAEEVVAAVASLYLDQLKPFGRILRKRIAERHVPVRKGLVLPEVDVSHIRAVCEECASLKLEAEEGGDWSVTLAGCPARFVDTYDPVDVYPEDLWTAAAEYFENAPREETTLQGGRYSCARTLLFRNLTFLANRSLGQVCHIIQLAITDRKLLGYLDGAVVPYSQSQSMMKEICASQQQACSNICAEAASLKFATWDSAQSCLRTILAEAAAVMDKPGLGVVPISNIKRTFRTQFQLELSETILGYSKLSELLQDARFKHLCTVELEKDGYSVVQRGQAISPPPVESHGSEDQHELASIDFCQGERPCVKESDVPVDVFDSTSGPTPVGFGPTPVPWPCSLQTNGAEEPSFLTQLLPLYLQDLHYCGVSYMDTCCRQFCPDEPLRLEDAGDMSGAPNYFGPAEHCNEFYPVEPLRLEGASEVLSAPNYVGQMMYPSGLLGLAVLDEGILSRKVEPACGSMPAPNEAVEIDKSSCAADPLTSLAEGASYSARKLFCFDEPLQAKDARAVLPAKKNEENARHRQPQWPSLSPWKDGKLQSMVRNTFIHTNVLPPTPVIGSLRRSMSLGHTQRRGSGSTNAPRVITLSDHITEA